MKSKVKPETIKVKTRKEFYSWMKNNFSKVPECFIEVKLGDPKNAKGVLSYLDAVEVALCFGWIDSIKYSNGNTVIQKFSKRTKIGQWSELNKARVRRLIKLKEMTEEGLKACPDLNKEYECPKIIINRLIKKPKAYDFFVSCPKLYQDIRLSNLEFLKGLDKKQYNAAFKNLIKNCEQEKMFGQWNDFGRLLEN